MNATSEPRGLGRLPAATLVLAAAVLLGTAAMVYFTHRSLTQIREELPIAALHQQRDVSGLSRDVNALLRAAEALRAEPSAERLAAARRALDTAQRRLRVIEEAHDLSHLPDSAAMLEAVEPALGDVARWLDDGVHGLAPGSPEVAALVARRLADAQGQLDALAGRAQGEVAGLLEDDADDLARLRDVLAVVFVFGALLVLVILFYVIRGRRAEAATEAAERRLREAIELVSDGFALFDPAGRLVLCNAAYARLFPGAESAAIPGVRFDELLRHAAQSGQIPDAVGREDDWVAERLLRFHAPSGPVELRLADGHWFQLVEHRTDDGGVVAIATDITEARRRESELREAGEDLRDDNLLLDAALANMSQGLAMFDEDECLIICNRRFLELYDLPPEMGRPGVPFARILAASARLREGPEGEDEGAAPVEPNLGVLRTREEKRWREVLTDGRVVEVFHRPLASGGSVVTYEDMTHEYRAEEALREAKAEAEVASKAKSDFLASVSHELRTPLNAIIGFSEVMEGEMFGPLGDRHYMEYARDIHESGHHLLSLINDILDLSKIEAGKLELREENLAVADIIQSAVRLVRQRAESAGVELTRALAPRLPRLVADSRAVKQILLNFLTNAIKYTPPGGRVTLGAELAASGELVFFVSDTGQGMSEEDLEKALSPFGQVDSATTRRVEGTGLGLPLSKHLVELHGGTLEIESQPHQGTTVRARFPAARTRPPDEEPAPGGEGPENGGEPPPEPGA